MSRPRGRYIGPSGRHAQRPRVSLWIDLDSAGNIYEFSAGQQNQGNSLFLADASSGVSRGQNGRFAYYWPYLARADLTGVKKTVIYGISNGRFGQFRPSGPER